MQAIVINYTVCVIEGSLARGHFPPAGDIVYSQWFSHTIFLGTLFISVFYITGLTVKFSGVAVTSIANKLSLIIPVMAAWFLYRDPFSPLKIAGIVTAMAAVVLAAYKKEEEGKAHNFNYYFFPLLILIGSGTIDTFIKWNQANFLQPEEFDLFLIFVFGTAAVIGWVILISRYIYFKEKINRKSITHGLLLGIPNYGTMFFLMKVLDQSGWSSSTVFPVNNIAIVVTCCLVAYFIFREKLSVINVAGILLAILAIVLIMQSEKAIQ